MLFDLFKEFIPYPKFTFFPIFSTFYSTTMLQNFISEVLLMKRTGLKSPMATDASVHMERDGAAPVHNESPSRTVPRTASLGFSIYKSLSSANRTNFTSSCNLHVFLFS